MLITRRMLELQASRRKAKLKNSWLIESVEHDGYELLYQPGGEVIVPSCVHVGKGSLLAINEAVGLDTAYCPSLHFGEKCAVEVPESIGGATVVNMADYCSFRLKDTYTIKTVTTLEGTYEKHYYSSIASLFVSAGAGSRVDLDLDACSGSLDISIKGDCFVLRICSNYVFCYVYSGDLKVEYNGKTQIFPEHYSGTVALFSLGSSGNRLARCV